MWARAQPPPCCRAASRRQGLRERRASPLPRARRRPPAAPRAPPAASLPPRAPHSRAAGRAAPGHTQMRASARPAPVIPASFSQDSESGEKWPLSKSDAATRAREGCRHSSSLPCGKARISASRTARHAGPLRRDAIPGPAAGELRGARSVGGYSPTCSCGTSTLPGGVSATLTPRKAAARARPAREALISAGVSAICFWRAAVFSVDYTPQGRCEHRMGWTRPLSSENEATDYVKREAPARPLAPSIWLN